ncbi:hypothetical protein Asp14428_71780 [Actinoplanes sp. NBRC 14428]|nr:hypothetical protein Asp14428_71780 [Actinoplanes sp. NBRC 14428]
MRGTAVRAVRRAVRRGARCGASRADDSAWITATPGTRARCVAVRGAVRCAAVRWCLGAVGGAGVGVGAWGPWSAGKSTFAGRACWRRGRLGWHGALGAGVGWVPVGGFGGWGW